jgi:uncharacterized repeat protein (TIGR01451 family)
MKSRWRTLTLLWVLCCVPVRTPAFWQPNHPELPNFDRRQEQADREEVVSGDQRLAADRLRGLLPGVKIQFDPLTGTPNYISAAEGFLSGHNGEGKAISATAAAAFSKADPYRATKAFLAEHKLLFGHGSEALDHARVKREFVTSHNGLRTVVWEQQVNGIPVFEALLISHTTRQGELVTLSSHFLPGLVQAAGLPASNRPVPLAAPALSARRATALAAANIGEDVAEAQLLPAPGPPETEVTGPEQRQDFRATRLKGNTVAKLVWLPTSKDALRLCWNVVLMSRSRGEMFRVLVDAQTGEPMLRRCLTEHISDATYRVYTSDSPSPFSPGYSTPVSNQPPLVARSLLTLGALDTNASPAGWIADGVNETIGNNVDAHTDPVGDDVTDLMRPQGSPFRVFDFALDLTQQPGTYASAAVVQLFYWCNWMHDQLYDLGFTEAAGNFQNDNFGRGGRDGDAVLADAQDAAGANNSDFTAPEDGLPGRMQIYIFTGPSPNHDADLDAELILHEYTHGLSNRRVGGGVGISALQSRGMGEGWSDFYALSLLSADGDDPNGVYAWGAYSAYQLLGSLFGFFDENYYFGLRRYPYCTDLTKNPLTFKDIDPTQASPHTSIPHSPVIADGATEVHNMGEVWCVTLREARANLIAKSGWAAGNQLILQLVTDGMNIAPANPTFLQARDAILQADLVDTGGANQHELWTAFAKRGMGASASSPPSSSTTGVFESFDVLDDLRVAPVTNLAFAGQSAMAAGGPCQTYTLNNNGSGVLDWVAYIQQPWVSVTPDHGTLPPGTSNAVEICLTPVANSLTGGTYSATLVFSNVATGNIQTRGVTLQLTPPRLLFFALDTNPGWALQGQWQFGQPAGLGGGAQTGNPDPTNGATGSFVFGVNLEGDYATTVGGPYYLSAGPFDLSGCTVSQLKFQRWLNSDYQPYVEQTIDVSANGTQWHQVWNNGTAPITDDAWSPVSYSLSPYADNSPSVFVRWGYQIDSVLAYPYSGWNIDDIEIDGNPPCSLSLTAPSVVMESNGVLTASVTVSPGLTNDLLVNLSSSDSSALNVPLSVTIPAGQSQASFNLSIVDDGQLNGMRIVTVSASAPRCMPGIAVIRVVDDETATLSLSLPPSAIQGQGTLQGSVQLGGLVPVDTHVALSSSDTTQIQVPPSVIIPAEQSSVAFTLTVLDNGQITGPQLISVTAQATGWTNGTASVTVLGNKNLDLALSLPAQAWETAGLLPNAGLVAISGTLPTNLTVSLLSSAPGSLVVPPTVSIQAGQTNQTFDVTTVDDSVQTGDRSIIITAQAPGFNNGTNSILLLDAENPPLPSNPTPADGQTNVQQSTVLAWQSGFLPQGVITNDIYFGTNPAPGPGDLLASTTNTSWVLPVLAPLTTYFWQVVAHDIGTRPGPVWRFTTRGVDHFAWGILPSPQYVNSLFAVTLTAEDSYGNTVSNFTGTVALSGYSSPTLFSENFESGNLSGWTFGSSTATPSITTNTAAGGNNSLTIVGGGPPYEGIWHSLANLTPSQINFYVRASATNLAGGYFVVGDATNDVDTTSSKVALSFSMRADGTMGIDCGSGGSWTVPYVAEQWYGISLRLNWNARTVDYYVDGALAASGIPLCGTGVNYLSIVHLYNLDDTQSWWDDLEFIANGQSQPVTVSPTNSAPFVNGIWSGSLAVLQLATNVSLLAQDSAGHSGLSGLFNVALTNDLSLSLSYSPQPAVTGSNLIYTIVVSNTGAADSTGVMVSDLLPSGTTFISARASQGTCTNAGGVVTCQVGTVTGGTNATIAIVVVPTTAGVVLTNQATVTRAENEAYLDNNSAMVTTGVAPPGVSISDQSVPAAVLSTTNMLFTVSLTAPSAQAVALSYSTSDGTAVGGQDFISTNGILAFPPGSSNAAIAVTILPDIGIQTNRTFYLTLSAPVNAVLGNSQGIGTIVNQTGLLGVVDYFVWSPITTPKFSAAPFGVTLTAFDVFGNVITGFTGVVSLTAAAPGLGGSSIQISPVVSSAFANGVWSGTITIPDPVSAVTLSADDGNGHGGSTAEFNVLPPGISARVVSSPTNQTVVLGQTVTFMVTADGTPELNYQWTFDGNNLTGATNSSLMLTNVLSADAGYYAVQVSNVYGSDISSNALLTVNEPARITGQPTNLVVVLGGSGQFTVLASGTPELNYQWSFNGTNLTGATNSSLLLTNVQISDAGTYAVQVSNPFGSDTSSNALLTVLEPARVVGQPVSQAVLAGASASFTVLAAGTPPLSYAWIFNGTNLAGATNSSLLLTNVHPTDAGYYAVQVANAYGSDSSSNAVLAVNEPARITGQPTNLLVVLGDSGQFAVLASGTPALSYQWSFNGTNLTDATNSWLLLTNVQVSEAGTYSVEVSNTYGSDTSSNATLTIAEPARVVEQPTNLVVDLGGSGQFAVLASGTPALSYQWSRNGSSLTGATNSWLLLTNVQVSDAGAYAVQVSNAYGSDTSSNALLTVATPPPPSCAAVPAGLVGWWAAENNAWDSAGGNTGTLSPDAGFAPGRVGTAFQFNGSDARVDLGDPEALKLTNSLSLEAWIWINNLPSTAQGQAQILFRGDPRACLDPYFLCVQSDGSIRFHVEDDSGTVPCGVDLNTAPVATQQWTHVTAVLDANTGFMQVYVNAQLAAQNYTSVRPLRDLVGGGVALGNTSSGSNPLPFDGLIDELSIYDRALAVAEVQSLYNAAESGKCLLPARIVANPISQNVASGASVTLSVQAAGSWPVYFQWSKNGTNLVDGATTTGTTSNILAIAGAQPADSGSYSVVVTNRLGAATSTGAAVFVYDLDHFAWNQVPSPCFVNVPFTVTIQAQDPAGQPVTNFQGSVTLALTNGAAVTPSVSGNFVQGVWSGTIAVSQSISNAVLVANDQAGHVGFANPINVVFLPSITVRLTGNTALISWPVEDSGFVLESSPSLSSPVWTPVGSSATAIGDTSQVRVHLTGASAFYRLHFSTP